MNDIYQKTLQKFGIDKQIDKLIEEMAELTVALMHYKEGRGNNVNEEFADVEIVMRQLRPVFNDNSEVDQFKKLKVERLVRYLNS